MKKLLTEWRKYLAEGISDVVYHYTVSIPTGAKILKQNRFLASGAFTRDVESELNKGKLYYFSTARTAANAYTGNYPIGVIFKLDGRDLARKYKGAPLDYWATSKYSSKAAANVGTDSTERFEAEDRIMLDEPYIEDADRYIDEIHFALPVYEITQGFFEDQPTRKVTSGALHHSEVSSLEAATKMAEQKGIPYYIHVDKQTFPFVEVGKKKAFKSFAAFMEEIQRAGKGVEDPPEPYTPRDRGPRPEIGEEEIFLYVQAALDILAGKQQFEGENIKGEARYRSESERKTLARTMFRNIAKGHPDRYGRYYREIDSHLHNAGKNPAARKTVDMLASLMRATKQKTIKDFEAYLNRAYNRQHSQKD